MATQKYVPKATPETQHYWDATAQGRLELPLCKDCNEYHFYPRTSCPKCGSENLEWKQVSGKAKLHSYVIAERPAPGFEGPLAIAVVELDEGPRMMTNIVGIEQTPEALVLDMPVEVEFEERDGMHVPVFHPAKGGN